MNRRKTLEKKQDRLLAFFDAVMAIAMTVLALEITIPRFSSISTAERYDFFVSLTCYLISFVAMSTLWYVHNNFFSSHDLTGNNVEIVLHLVLLFVITLFQPLTRAIGQYPNDTGIRVFYLTDFFVMYGLTALIMVLIRRREDLFSDKKAERLSKVKEKREEEPDKFQMDDSNLSDEAKKLRNLMQLVYAIENPEELQKKFEKEMPDEYQQEWAELKKQRELSYHLSLYAVFAMAATVLAAVITLMFSIWWSYLCLAAGLIVIFLIRHLPLQQK